MDNPISNVWPSLPLDVQGKIISMPAPQTQKAMPSTAELVSCMTHQTSFPFADLLKECQIETISHLDLSARKAMCLVDKKFNKFTKETLKKDLSTFISCFEGMTRINLDLIKTQK